jgi:predicted nucleic acid-binding protein
LTPEELYFGAEKRRWGGRKRRALDKFIAQRVVLPADLEIAKISARLRAERERVGRALDRGDAWIAATALGYGLPLFTPDRDFEGIEDLHLVTAPDSWLDRAVEQESTGERAPINTAPVAPTGYLLH